MAGQLTSNATLSGDFGLLREAGDGLVITVSTAKVTSATGSVIAYEADLVVGVGGGAFAVTNGVPTCGAPISSAQILMTVSYLAPE